MKKLLALLLTLLLILGLAACGNTEPSGNNDDPVEDPESSDINNMKNSWTECSADEIYAKTGYRFGIPKEALKIKYYWNETIGIAEMQFDMNDEEHFSARAKKADPLTNAFEDISGMEYDFSSNSDNYDRDCYIRNNDQELRGDLYLTDDENKTVNLGLWYYESKAGGYSFSLGTVTTAGVIDISTVASEVFILDKSEKENNKEAEYDPNYWADMYGTSVCPFNITFAGVSADYYFRGGGDLRDWVYTENNINNWYYFNDMIISYDNKYAIGPEFESLSSYCTYEAGSYDGPVLSKEEQKEIQNGIFYVFNSYTPIRTTSGINIQVAGTENDPELKCRGINNEFNKEDALELFVDLSAEEGEESKAEMFILPHQAEGYKPGKLSNELKELTDCRFTPEKTENNMSKVSFTVSDEVFEKSEDGRFDIVLTYDDIIVSCTVIHVTQIMVNVH